MKKRVPFFLFVLGLCITYGSVVFSAPAFGPGEYLDPPCAPGTTYLGDDCTTAVLGIGNDVWNGTPGAILFTGASGLAEAPTDLFWDETNSRLGIGTDTPTVALDVVGDVHILSGTGELAINNDFDWTGDSSSFNATRAVSDNDGIENVNEFTTDITTSGAVTNTTYRGLASVLTYTGNDDMSGIAATGAAPLVGISSRVESSGLGSVGIQGLLVTAIQSGDGVITEDTAGGQFIAVYTGDGSIGASNNLDAFRSNTYNGIAGSGHTGDIGNMRGFSATTIHGSTGTTTNAYGAVMNVVARQAGGTISTAYGNDVKIIAEAGQIQQATNIKLNSLVDIGTIDNATGIEFNAGTYDGDIPGLFSTGTTIGISFRDYNAEGSLEGDNVYGIYFNDVGSLQGTTSQYALYIGDTDAENWFSNGLMIGDDTGGAPSLNSKIDDDNGGVGSTQLYIGTNTIDTTAPSDERTKENIESTIYGLDDLNQIDIVDFIYNQSIIDDNNEQHTGVLAQQVESIYPEAVSRRSDGYLMVDYKTFIPLTIRSIQELDIKVSDIEIMANETFVSRLRVWLASATNGIERIFAGRVETNEIQTDQLCVGSRCISESEFIELLDRNSVSGSSATGGDETDQEIEEEITENELEEELGTSSEEEVIEIESEDNVPLGLAEEESNISPESEEAIESSEQQEEEITETPSVSEEENNEAPSEDSGSEDEGDPVLE